MKKVLNYLDVSKVERISFRNDINSLRAIAVLAVVFYHAEFRLFSGGWLGVDIFFVISGYLISNIIISELNSNKFSFKDFYLRRIKRILPGLFSVLLLTIPFAYWLLTPKAMLEYSSSMISSLFFYANYFFQNLDFYTAEPSRLMPLLHTWSLAIEEQFYLIFPLFCFLLFKFIKNYKGFIILITLLLSIYLNSLTPELIKFYQIQFRAWELLLGGLVMIVEHKVSIKHLEKIGLFLVFLSIFYFDSQILTINSIEPRLISNFGVSLILLSKSSPSIDRFLGNKLISFIGICSYSIYLIHQPLFAFFEIFQKRYSRLGGIEYKWLLLIALFFLSYLNWKYVEKVFQNTSIKKLFLNLFISIFIILIFSFFSFNNNGFKDRYSYVPDEVLFYSFNYNIYPNSFDATNYKFKNKDCSYELGSSKYCKWYNQNQKKNIYLLGDSQSNALAVSFLIEFEELKDEYNLFFLRGSLGRCLLSKQHDSLGDIDECGDETFINFIDSLNKDKDLVIAIGRFDTWLEEKGQNEVQCKNCDYKEVFTQRLLNIANKSKYFYIIETIPTYEYPIAESYLYKNSNWGKPISQDLKTWEVKYSETNEFLMKLDQSNIKLIPTIPIFCETKVSKCFASSEDKLYYSDTNHLTLEGAKLISQNILEIIKP